MKARWVLAVLAAVLVAALLLFGLRSRRLIWRAAPATVTSQGTTANQSELSPLPTVEPLLEVPRERRSRVDLAARPAPRAWDAKRHDHGAIATSSVSGNARYVDWTPAREVEVALVPRSMLHDPQWRTLHSEDGHGRSNARGEFRLDGLVPGEYFLRASNSDEWLGVTEPFALLPGESRGGLVLVLTAGSFVCGRIVVPAGGSCAGLSVSLATDGLLHAPSFAQQELGSEGRFHLGPVSSGRHAIHLRLPRPTTRTIVSTPPGVFSEPIAIVDLRGGETLERDFELQDFPGTIAIEVLVNERVAPHVALGFWTEDREPRFVQYGDTDEEGRFGPTPAFPGTWRVAISDRRAGWTYTHAEPVFVTRAGVAWARIDVTVAEGTVTFFDEASGGLLRGRTIYVLGPQGDGPLRRLKTDHGGRIPCTLASGDYRFRLEPVGIEITTSYRGMPTSVDPAHTVRFTWTSEGPAVSEVRL